MLRISADYHTHTFYSDGTSTMQDNVQAAIKAGLSIVGISDHGYRHLGFGVKYKDYPQMKEEVLQLRERYPKITILFGAECNILDDRGNIDMDDRIRPLFDYVLAGYHFAAAPTRLLRGFANHVNNYLKPFNPLEEKYNTRALIEAMRQNDLFALTHPGDKGRIDTLALAETAVSTGTLLEINDRHHNLTTEQLLLLKDTSCRYLVSSDAHSAQAVGQAPLALERIERSGLDLSKVVNLA